MSSERRSTRSRPIRTVHFDTRSKRTSIESRTRRLLGPLTKEPTLQRTNYTPQEIAAIVQEVSSVFAKYGKDTSTADWKRLQADMIVFLNNSVYDWRLLRRGVIEDRVKTFLREGGPSSSHVDVVLSIVGGSVEV